MRAIAGDGVTLEPQTAAHAGQMFAVLSDPAIYEYENSPPPSLEWLRERYARLESRRSADGREQWLNWVIRIPTSELVGYVQATVKPDRRAAIAYELSSAHWGRGIARRAVQAMIAELAEHYGVHTLTAVFKGDNLRSRRLLERLGFVLAPAQSQARDAVGADELLMERKVSADGISPTENSGTIRCRMAACREVLDDGSGAELRMELFLRVQWRGHEARLQFEFPKLYIQRNLQMVEGLGMRGWQVIAAGHA